MKMCTFGWLCNEHTGFASGGVTCKFGALCFYSSLVLADSLVLRNPPERKARERYNQWFIKIPVILQPETTVFCGLSTY